MTEITAVFETGSSTYSVTLSGGANATTSGGATSQTDLSGAMTAVTYTADSGHRFEAFDDITNNGIVATRTSDTVVTVSGTPTANATITVPDAVAIPTYAVTYRVANGTWSDGSTEDRTEAVQSGSRPAGVPTGMKASSGYTGGAWDTDPAGATITEATTFTYAFAAKEAAAVTKAPEAKDLTYSGRAQALVAEGTASGGTMQYALGEDATSAPTDGWSASVPTGTDAGTYFVWYKVVGDESHADSDPACVEATIAEAATPATHTVTFDANCHGTAPATQKVEDGEKATKPADPTADGYTFGGWFSDKDCKEAYDFSKAVTADITLYAKWTESTTPAPAKATYSIKSVAGTTGDSHAWTKGSKGDVTITATRSGDKDTSFDHFAGVSIDGKELKRNTDYTAKEGSTVVTLKAATLQALSTGEHTVAINFDDGSVSTKLTVKEAAAQKTPATGAAKKAATPKTGDASLAAAPLAVLGALAVALTAKARREA